MSPYKTPRTDDQPVQDIFEASVANEPSVEEANKERNLRLDFMAEMMAEYANKIANLEALSASVEASKKEIEAYATEHSLTLESSGYKVIYTSRGSTDWEGVAMDLRPTQAQIFKFSKIDWKALAEDIGKLRAPALKQAKERFYAAGVAFYSLQKKAEHSKKE